ncbi:MAG: hypothetical protein IKC39_04455, partial [Clostridia bacterium]|nr:hypothetical protein [Clostridia bacterium]
RKIMKFVIIRQGHRKRAVIFSEKRIADEHFCYLTVTFYQFDCRFVCEQCLAYVRRAFIITAISASTKTHRKEGYDKQ